MRDIKAMSEEEKSPTPLGVEHLGCAMGIFGVVVLGLAFAAGAFSVLREVRSLSTSSVPEAAPTETHTAPSTAETPEAAETPAPSLP